MSGYGGCDDESLHAIILGENGVHAAQEALKGPVYTICQDCGEYIPAARVTYARTAGITCTRCLECQSEFDRKPKTSIRMLTKML